MATGVTSTRLVGRSLELAQLQAALAEAAAGQPSLAFVVGESGVGKSRLVAELQARAAADGTRVLQRRLRRAGRGRARLRAAGDRAAPARARRRPGARRRCPTTIRAELATLLPGPRRARASAAAATRRACSRRCSPCSTGSRAHAPVLLVIEDLHWADASTRAFLRFLASTLGDGAAAASSRPTGPTSCTAATRCARCWRSSSACARCGSTSPALTRDELARAARGHPRRAARRRAWSSGCTRAARATRCSPRSCWPRGSTASARVPPSLAAALALRIERLGDDAQEVVRVLSAGGQLDDAVLAEVAGLDRRALREGLREAVASHIVVLDGDRYALRHALLREAVHDELLPGERAELHRALARALEGGRGGRAPERAARGGDRAPLPRGRRPAGRARPRRCAPASPRWSVQAYREGATLFERALELWDRVPDAAGLTGTDEAELLERAAACHFYADDLQRSVTLARRALSLVDEAAEPRRAAWLYGMLQRALWELLRPDEADEALERGLALLADDGPSPERAGLLARQAKTLMLQSRYHRAVGVARRALAEQARARRAGRPPRRRDRRAERARRLADGDRRDRGGRRGAAPRARRSRASAATSRTSPPPPSNLARRAAPRRPHRGGAGGRARGARRARVAAGAPGLARARDRPGVVRRRRLGGGRRGARRRRPRAGRRAATRS